MVEVSFAGEKLVLLAGRALYRPRVSALILADVHLGKDAAFRAAGVPVPAGATAKDLARIDALLTQTGANRLIVLGDLVHARTGKQPEMVEAMAQWRARFAGEVMLVRGNHDRGSGKVPQSWGIREVEEPWEEEGMEYVHFAEAARGQMGGALCGHVHPVYSVRDFDGSRVSIPCFVLEERLLALPAFGSFTGGHAVPRSEGRRIFLSTGKSVTEVRGG